MTKTKQDQKKIYYYIREVILSLLSRMKCQIKNLVQKSHQKCLAQVPTHLKPKPFKPGYQDIINWTLIYDRVKLQFKETN